MATVLEFPAKRLIDAFSSTMQEKDVVTITDKNPLLQAKETGVPIPSQVGGRPFDEITTAQTVAPAGTPPI